MVINPWLMVINGDYHLVMTNIATENIPFILDLPIQNGDFL